MKQNDKLTAKNIGHKAKLKAEKVKNTTAGKLKDTREKASEIKSEIQDKIEHSAADIREKLRKVGDTLSESEFWEEATENISEGASKIGEEARVIGEKISSYSEILFGKIKDKSSEAFKTGLDLTRDAVNKAQKRAEDLRNNIVISRLNKQKKEIAARLGMKFYLEIKNNDNKVPENLLKKRIFITLLKELENIDREILG